MAQTPSKLWTPWAVLSAARELAKTVEQNRVLTEQGRMFYRLALSEIVALLNGSSDPSYWASAVLSVTADQELLQDNAVSGGVITALSVSGSIITITRNIGVFVAGSVLSIMRLHDSNIMQQCYALVTVGGGVATANIISGSMTTYIPSGQLLSVFVAKSLSTTSVDISSYKYDNIVAIKSSNSGLMKYLTPDEFFSIERADYPHKSFDDDICWTQMGNTLYFNVGSKVTSGIGTVTMYYKRQPDYPSTDVNYSSDSVFVDLADKWIPLLVKRIYTYCILQTENDIPKNLAQEMALDYQTIAGYSTAELQNRNKQGEKR